MSDPPPTGINDGGETPRVRLPKVLDPLWIDLCGVDWPLLLKQKRTLITLIQEPNRSLPSESARDLRGLLHLVDHLQDRAAEKLGEPAVFGPGELTAKGETPMSVRFPTRINVGGKVSRALLPKLIEVLNEESLYRDWGEPIASLKSEADLLECLDDNETLYFCHEEQPWGRFDRLERFLVQNHIPFERGHAPRYDYCGELAQYRPGMKESLVCPTDDEGSPMIDAREVQDLRDLIRRSKPDQAIARATRKLDFLLKPLDLPPLEKFEVVDKPAGA